MTRPAIFYPPASPEAGGKYHRSTLAQVAACGAGVILDTAPMGAIHHDGAGKPHPLLCRRCLRQAGATPTAP